MTATGEPNLDNGALRADTASVEPRRRARAWILIAGLVLCQAVLYGESLLGQKVLLPLDLLALPRVYLPAGSDLAEVPIHNAALSDRVLYYELERRFAATELRVGRLPLWNPYSYGGVPLGSLTTYSPFNFVYYLFPHPVTLAWLELCVALAAGLGAYLFFRRVSGVGFWPAAIGAWVYPLSGFFVLWQGFALLHAVAWLPWLLLATAAVVRNPRGWAGPGLALASACVMWGGRLAPQVLLASGLFAVWRVIDRHGWRPRPPVLRAVAVLGAGWTIGMMLASPDWLHLNDYLRASARLIERTAGLEDHPPVGLSAVPQVVLPDIYGSRQTGHYRTVAPNRLESSAAGYLGLLAVLVLVPIGLADRRRRSMNGMWLGLTLVSFAWAFNVPGLVSLMRLPGVEIISHNRSVFIACFALLAVAVAGLERLRRGELRREIWFSIPVLLLLVATFFCAYRVAVPPEPIATELARASNWDLPGSYAPDIGAVAVIQRNYQRTAIRGLVLCVIGLGLWGWLWRSPAAAAMVPVLGALMLAELFWFGRGLNPQVDPALYFPRIPVLTEIGKAPPGRILCVGCLPPRLSETHGLRDIRGYDGFDPLRLVEVLAIARDDPKQVANYAQLQWYAPAIVERSDGRLIVSPILDMLNVRYLVFRTPRPPVVKALFEHDDYWAAENPNALPRVHVPERVEFKASDDEVLKALAAPGFDPVSVAYVGSPLDLPNPMRGEATIDAEVPTRVTVTARMKTTGLVVLADLWFDGWTAELNGEPVPIVRTNHALRGVVVPAGTSTLVFSYAPAGFTAGIRLIAVALVVLAGWGLIGVRRARRDRLGR